MGGYSANSQNVNFAFDLALQVARDLHTLSGAVSAKQDARATEATKAIDSWEGGHREAFNSKMTAEDTNAGTVSSALVTLANLFASKWAEARGEQDRINHARYVQHEKDDDSWVEDGYELVAGEDDYGAPPDNPSAPSPPDYTPTRDPIHPEYE
jgi:type VI protein secretion system component VasF